MYFTRSAAAPHAGHDAQHAQRHRLAQDHHQHLRLGRAKRHADADLGDSRWRRCRR